MSVAGLNRNRKVLGNVNAECPHPLHSSPFGNWGTTSNFGGKINGHQFDGWCHDTRVCDNSGNCRNVCRDGWYEWNSCTDHPDFRAPNCDLYNDGDCNLQKTTQDVNVMSTRNVSIPVRCPLDTNGDGVFDAGGCKDLAFYDPGVNFVSLYELDPLSTDELVQTLYFPATPVALHCDINNCPAAGSNWVQPINFADPPVPQRAFAEMATVVNFGNFSDPNRVCPTVAPEFRTVSAASFAEFASPGSIVSAFGFGLANRTEEAPPAQPQALLGGVRVTVTGLEGVVRDALLYYVSPSQLNFVIPDFLEPGPTTVRVYSNGLLAATGLIQVNTVAPGIFTANSAGTGPPAAIVQRVTSSGTTFSYPFNCRANAACLPVPINVDPALGDVYLQLYGTGLRARSSQLGVVVQIGERAADVLYAGPQPQFPGLDQLNIRLAPELAGSGIVEVQISVDGQPANPFTLQIQ